MNKQGLREQGNEGTESRKQESGIRGYESGNLERLLRQALPAVGDDTGPEHDLWSAMLRRLRAESTPEPVLTRIPWFDWALVGGLVALLAFFPASIPVLLYYL